MATISNLPYPVVEKAIRTNVKDIIITKKGYLACQIDAICLSNTTIPDSYNARMKGYYSRKSAFERLEHSSTELATNIKNYALQLSDPLFAEYVIV